MNKTNSGRESANNAPLLCTGEAYSHRIVRFWAEQNIQLDVLDQRTSNGISYSTLRLKGTDLRYTLELKEPICGSRAIGAVFEKMIRISTDLAHEAALIEDKARSAAAKQSLIEAAFDHFNANSDCGQADAYTVDLIAGAVYSAIEEVVAEGKLFDLGDIVFEATERTDEYVDKLLVLERN